MDSPLPLCVSAVTPVADGASSPKSSLQWKKKVRVVGSIRPHLDSGGDGSSSTGAASLGEGGWISVVKPDGECSDHATLIFRDREESVGRSESYKLDWCYDQNEGTGKIFSEEVMPLVRQMFEGADATVFAFGARGSGKTELIVGSQEKPGLVSLTITEIQKLCEDSAPVKLSFYEVCQDRVFDILNNEQEVQVLEDALGEIQFKGLSQVTLESCSDISQLYYGCGQRRISRNTKSDVGLRSHKGIIVHVSSVDKEVKFGRINFVDLAGYEDTTLKSNDKSYLLETARINKSLHALQNVVYALNARERHVPYRENRLTNFLKVFICEERSQALMITLLKPMPCHETIRVVRMASRSCLLTNKIQTDSTRKSKSIQRAYPPLSPSSGRSKVLGTSTKKQGVSRFAHDKKDICTPSCTEGRKLFSIKTPDTTLVKKKSSTNITVEADSIKVKEVYSMQTYETQVSTSSLDATNREKKMIEEDMPIVPKDCVIKEDEGYHIAIESSPPPSETQHEEHASTASQDCITKDNEVYHHTAKESSFTISEKLREITNSLKLLSSQPLSVVTPYKTASCTNQITWDQAEPKTPGNSFGSRSNDNWDMYATPQKNSSIGFKKSLNQDFVTFLNSASKEELMELKGIGEKRATYILEYREETPQPFKDVSDLKEFGLSSKQIKEMMGNLLGL